MVRVVFEGRSVDARKNGGVTEGLMWKPVKRLFEVLASDEAAAVDPGCGDFGPDSEKVGPPASINLLNLLASDEVEGIGAGKAGPSPKDTGLPLNLMFGALGAWKENPCEEVDGMSENPLAVRFDRMLSSDGFIKILNGFSDGLRGPGNLILSSIFTGALVDFTNFAGVSSELLTVDASDSTAGGFASTLRPFAIIESPPPSVEDLSSSVISTESGL